jgi:hypothetical protein
VWGHGVYTVFGILLLAFVLLLLVTATLAVALVYFQLSVENHRWWWRTFGAAATLGAFMYAYSAYYYHYQSQMDGVLQASFFFGYTFLLCYSFALMVGTVAWLVAWKFIKHIYRSVKID